MLNVVANQESETAVKFQIGRVEGPEKGRGISSHITVMLLLSHVWTHTALSAFTFVSVQDLNLHTNSTGRLSTLLRYHCCNMSDEGRCLKNK